MMKSAGDDHPDTGGGNDRTTAREDYQWNDDEQRDTLQAVCGEPSSTGSRTILAYYSFDDSTARDWSGNHRDGVTEGAGVTFSTQGVSGTCSGSYEYIINFPFCT